MGVAAKGGGVRSRQVSANCASCDVPSSGLQAAAGRRLHAVRTGGAGTQGEVPICPLSSSSPPPLPLFDLHRARVRTAEMRPRLRFMRNCESQRSSTVTIVSSRLDVPASMMSQNVIRLAKSFPSCHDFQKRARTSATPISDHRPTVWRALRRRRSRSALACSSSGMRASICGGQADGARVFAEGKVRTVARRAAREEGDARAALATGPNARRAPRLRTSACLAATSDLYGSRHE